MAVTCYTWTDMSVIAEKFGPVYAMRGYFKEVES